MRMGVLPLHYGVKLRSQELNLLLVAYEAPVSTCPTAMLFGRETQNYTGTD